MRPGGCVDDRAARSRRPHPTPPPHPVSAPRLFPSILLILTGAAVVSTSAASAASSTGFPVVSSPRIAVSNRTPEELYAVDTATRRRCCTVELDVGGRLTSPLDGSGGNG